MQPSSASDRRAFVLLGLGAACGVALAAFDVVGSNGGPERPPGAIALVNGRPIATENYQRLVSRAERQRRDGSLDAEEKSRLLDSLIDDELLLQRGIELGLAQRDRTARRAILSAMVSAATADLEEPNEAELRRFHAERPELFTEPPRLAVDAAFVRQGERSAEKALARAREIARRLRGAQPLEATHGHLGDPLPEPLPAQPVPLATVRERLGSTPASFALRLEVGEVSDPVRGAGGYYVMRLNARVPGDPLPFDEARARVRRLYLRTLGARAVERYVAELRADAEIEVFPEEEDSS